MVVIVICVRVIVQGFGDLRTVDVILTCLEYPDFNVRSITRSIMSPP